MAQIKKEFTVCWTIRNFCFYDFEKNIYIHSPAFTPKNIDESEWDIYINCVSCDAGEYLSLGLYREERERRLTLDVEMELCSSDNEILYSTEKRRGVEIVRRDSGLFPRVALLEELNQKLKDCSTDTLIIRCRMSVHSESETVQDSLSGSCTIQTTIHLDESSFRRPVWFSESAAWCEQLTFRLNGNGQLEVNIKAPQDGILFEIIWKGERTSLKTKCEITLLNCEGIEKFGSSEFLKFSKQFPICHFSPFRIRTYIFKSKYYFILKFTFTYSTGVWCHDFVEKTKDQNLLPTPNLSKKITTGDSLSEDLRKMFLNKKHADVSFCVDGQVISAHKLILSSRSPVFSAMFDQQMSENETGVIDITDMDVQTLKLFLLFLYTGELEDSDCERMLELLLTAEKYQVPSLREKCSEFLKPRLSLDNVCDVVSVADMVGEQTLKVAAIDFIKENYGELFSSSKWSLFIKNNVNLCSEIFYQFSENLKKKEKRP